MHRAAEAPRAAGLFPKKLSHAGVRASTARQRVSVITISGDDVVVVAHRSHCAGHHCFLTDVKMTKSADLLRLILLTGPLLETPDQQHPRLNESCEIFRVTRIAQAGKRVGDCVENCRSNNGSR